MSKRETRETSASRSWPWRQRWADRRVCRSEGGLCISLCSGLKQSGPAWTAGPAERGCREVAHSGAFITDFEGQAPCCWQFA